MTSLKLFILSMVVFAFLDFIWIGYVMQHSYKTWFGSMARLNPDGSFNINYLAALGVYLLLAAAVVHFVIPLSAGAGQLRAFLMGALMGLIIYGVYDLTNAATLTRWPLNLILADMAWGTFATGITAMVVSNVARIFRWL